MDRVSADERDLLVDLHGVTAMDTVGLFHLLDLHRRAELLRLRVLVTGWQPQPQQLMAQLVGIPGPGTATGERYAVAGFRRLLEDRAQRARDHADFAARWLPRASPWWAVESRRERRSSPVGPPRIPLALVGGYRASTRSRRRDGCGCQL
ncbi:STAS domain-containing protein [Streptomyces virginiae]|uniref:STAS domain-containing protein n=1 Tax=Streptomyces virginiae TaxID=1961 RepID=UPI00368A53E0